jgi:hypothetical protein
MERTANAMERMLRAETDFRLLTSFVHGIKGDARKEVRYRNPSSIEESLNIATVVHSASKLETRHRERELFTEKSEVL